jgi:hypothetical protein
MSGVIAEILPEVLPSGDALNSEYTLGAEYSIITSAFDRIGQMD